MVNVKTDFILSESDFVNGTLTLFFIYFEPVVYVSNNKYFLLKLLSFPSTTYEYKLSKLSTTVSILF